MEKGLTDENSRLKESNNNLNNFYNLKEKYGTFWSLSHRSEQYIYVLFDEIKETLKTVTVRSGSEKHKNDIFMESTLIYALISDRIFQKIPIEEDFEKM